MVRGVSLDCEALQAMSEDNVKVGYSEDICHFCGKKNAGYLRAEDAKPRGPFFDSCEKCARKPYPQPEQLKQAQKP
jgi:hypothetical protein